MVWNLRNHQQEHIFYGHTLEVVKLALDNKPIKKYLFSAGQDKSIIVWDI